MADLENPRAIHLPTAAWIAITAGILLPWCAVIVLLSRFHAHDHPTAAPATLSSSAKASALASTVETSKPGPWGELDYTRIVIEPPEDIIPPPTSESALWHLPGYDTAALEKLWLEAGLTSDQRTSLARSIRPSTDHRQITLAPEPALLLGLAPAARATIYAELARFPQNPLHADPFRFRADGIDEWFADSGLPEPVLQRIRQLIYVRAHNAAFSDLGLVLPLVPDAAARVRLIKTLSRKSALLAELRIPYGADTDALARYWGQGRRSKDIGVLLDSLAQRPAGGKLDVVHLLPSFARLLLCTFPTPTDNPRAASRDCHWTSFNFYAQQPDDRFSQLEEVKRTLERDYYPVSGTPAFGDIVLLVAAGNQGVHSCVYVADDVVFTKNGAAFSVPWTLARLENVVAFYTFAEPLEVRRFRRK